MSNRIQPEFFIDVSKGGKQTRLLEYSVFNIQFIADYRTIALFLIRPKTPQEQENSIYYPLNKQKCTTTK